MDVLGRCAYFLRQPEASDGDTAFKHLPKRRHNPRGFGTLLRTFLPAQINANYSDCLADRGLSSSRSPPRRHSALVSAAPSSLATVLSEGLSEDEEERVSSRKPCREVRRHIMWVASAGLF